MSDTLARAPLHVTLQSPMPTFRLQFDLARVPELAEDYRAVVDAEVVRIAPTVRGRGWFEHEELKVMCKWKSPRTQSRVASNSPELVREVTRVALSTTNEHVRIGVLQILNGVSWPTASVLLHFGHRDRYPILDARALIEGWREDYNELRPHTSLGGQSPNEFIHSLVGRMRPTRLNPPRQLELFEEIATPPRHS